ncbi:hypothetical protein BD310DRAFT_2910 [Dichomitus squalens]|uniref:Uncharacterized protein n=1 Tax=Dichomitus squalens TaxID=114155 RepID=A0A4Q9QDV2_9APHY|nr:hypothetical protein BD310DRAFT_2910 [Dichomitus squalens]
MLTPHGCLVRAMGGGYNRLDRFEPRQGSTSQFRPRSAFLPAAKPSARAANASSAMHVARPRTPNRRGHKTDGRHTIRADAPQSRRRAASDVDDSGAHHATWRRCHRQGKSLATSTPYSRDFRDDRASAGERDAVACPVAIELPEGACLVRAGAGTFRRGWKCTRLYVLIVHTVCLGIVLRVVA